MHFPIAAVVLLLVLAVAVRTRDRIVRTLVALVWFASIAAFVALWASDYRWSNQSGCREAYPGSFGYRAPDFERAPWPVLDEQSRWPLGRTCSGLDSDTGQFVSIGPGWASSAVAYGLGLCSVLGVIALIVRLYGLRRAGSCT